MSEVRTELGFKRTRERVIIETMFKVIDKESRRNIPFTLNSVQSSLDANLTGRDLVPKARQEGVSTYFLGRYTAACMMYENTRAVVISHETEATQRMLSTVRYFIENMRGPAPEISNLSKNEIVFPKMNSMFYIGTAGARAFGRGDTITHLHCSEYAYWINPKILMAGLLQAVPETSGEIAIESTGKGVGNDYHERCMRSASGNSRWKMHFFNWQDFPDYTTILTPDQEKHVLNTLNADLEEDILVNSLTPGQILWRRNKLEDMSFDLQMFKQEYPMTLDECFQATGSSIFHKVLYCPTDSWKVYAGDNPQFIDDKLSIQEGHPTLSKTYVIGGDVAAGLGQKTSDDSVLEVFCIDDMEQVGEWISRTTPPDIMACKAKALGEMFGDALLVIEANNHGILTLSELRNSSYPSHKIYRHSNSAIHSEIGPVTTLGFKTTVASKPLAIGNLRKLLASEIVIHSAVLKDQLATFVESVEGKLEAELGCRDDAVMASAMAIMGLSRASLDGPKEPNRNNDRPSTDYVDPFSLDNIIKELKGGGAGFLIPPQHLGSQ